VSEQHPATGTASQQSQRVSISFLYEAAVAVQLHTFQQTNALAYTARHNTAQARFILYITVQD
jgi:hypothetical protein